ncbi:MAG TPA: c-type cytochrome, partial [Rhizomicrobium sp.]|nr:c-type cytochrome [Rhizomicrobium sp.]
MMRKLLTASLLGLFAGIANAQAPGPFTAAQADAGRDAFLTSCAPCHSKTLQGGGEAPALIGDAFIGSWGKRDTKSLYTVIKASMPMGHPDSLGAETYAAITAFLLQANGAKAGSTALTPTTAVAIGSIATGKMPADVAQSIATAKPAIAPAKKAAEKTGVTVAGTVARYTPVTSEMLTHPADADWLMHLRSYDGWSYSPLTQVNTANAENLQLKWVWAMTDGGRQQMNPLVHDGVMFVSNNLDNRVQALDARTGTLIWENRVGPTLDNVQNANRTMALWQNLLIYPGTDAKLTALD